MTTRSRTCAADGRRHRAGGQLHLHLGGVVGAGEASALDEPGHHRGRVALADVGPEPPPSVEQLVGELGQPGHVDGELVEDRLVLVDAARSPARQLDPRRQQGQRGPQLVAGVVDELPLAVQRLLEGVEHLVEGVPEPGHLVVAARGHVQPQRRSAPPAISAARRR